MAGLESAWKKSVTRSASRPSSRCPCSAASWKPSEDDWLPEAQPWDRSIKLAREKEALGVYLSGHPLDAHRALLKAQIRTTTADLSELPDSQEVILGVVVTSLKEKVSKRGGRLAILTVEDLAGSVEVVVYGEVYERVASLLQQPSLPLWLKGHVVQEEKGPKLVAQEIASLETALPRGPSRLDVRLQAAMVTREQLLDLKGISFFKNILPSCPRPAFRVKMTLRLFQREVKLGATHV